MNNPSPLRYPGGKYKFYPVIREILRLNDLLGTTYIEPFAGGAGLALRLLLAGDVNRIVINDIDPHVYAFWDAIINHTDRFCDLLTQTPITVAEWDKQKATYAACDTADSLKLGFATFFLNRTNVSGVLTGGIIGGRNQQGEYKINARFPKDVLAEKIRGIAARKDDITIINEDASKLLGNSALRDPRGTFVNFDPPYVGKGAQLYRNSFSKQAHIEFARTVKRCRRRWIVTYDVDPLILQIYSRYRIGFLDVSYSVGEQKNAQEYIIFCHGLNFPESVARANAASGDGS